MFFSITREDESEFIEGVVIFKYLGRSLDWSDDDWSAVRRNIRKAHQVWIRLGKILLREGAYQLASAMFYKEVVQEVLLFVSEIWVVLTSMSKTLDGVYVGLLKQVTGKAARQQ